MKRLIVLILTLSIISAKGSKESINGHSKYYKSSNNRYCGASDNSDDDGDGTSTNICGKCWGYEDHCVEGKDFEYPICTNQGYSKTLLDQRRLFWEQSGFGYIKKFLNSLQTVCKSPNENGSSLQCSSEWEYCQGKNLYFDLREQSFGDQDRYIKGFLKSSEFGGICKVDKSFLAKKVQFDGELNAWKADFLHFSEFKESDIQCDIIEEKPTIFMKLDSGFNLYHHFCDFVNLYASQHINGSFSTDVNIVHWDPSNRDYFDLFEETWKAFSKYPLKLLSEYKGKRVCFKNAVFSLPPRMPYGLYYNMPVARHCHGSTFFEAFNDHLMHRLGINQDEFEEGTIRVTLLKRSTKFRLILNQDELIGAMKRIKILNVTAVDFKYRNISFIDQIRHSYNSDIIIGIHGAGLTHALFQPHWGALFELYNTEDPDCYLDLANIRGVEYYTWENKDLLFQQDKGQHPTLGEHPKFTNYAFNVDEFMRILGRAVDSVLKRREKYLHQ